MLDGNFEFFAASCVTSWLLVIRLFIERVRKKRPKEFSRAGARDRMSIDERGLSMGSFEETLGALLDAKLAPLRADVRALAQAIESLRRTLPPVLVPLQEAARMLGLS